LLIYRQNTKQPIVILSADPSLFLNRYGTSQKKDQRDK
jgi:hypothetical protein